MRLPGRAISIVSALAVVTSTIACSSSLPESPVTDHEESVAWSQTSIDSTETGDLAVVVDEAAESLVVTITTDEGVRVKGVGSVWTSVVNDRGTTVLTDDNGVEAGVVTIPITFDASTDFTQGEATAEADIDGLAIGDDVLIITNGDGQREGVDE